MPKGVKNVFLFWHIPVDTSAARLSFFSHGKSVGIMGIHRAYQNENLAV